MNSKLDKLFYLLAILSLVTFFVVAAGPSFIFEDGKGSVFQRLWPLLLAGVFGGLSGVFKSFHEQEQDPLLDSDAGDHVTLTLFCAGGLIILLFI